MELEEFIKQSPNEDQKERMRQMIEWTVKTFPKGHFEIKWNQPMFLLNNTYIIAYSYSKNHITVGCEGYDMELFRNKIEQVYKTGKMTFKIMNNEEINFALLEELISFKMKDKEYSTSFWK